MPLQYWNPPPYLGRALVLLHVQASGPLPPSRRAPALPHAQRLKTPLTIQEGSITTMRPSAPGPASPLRWDPTLTHILWLWTAPTSVVGSGADTYPMAFHGSWAIEEGLPSMACSEARVFPRHLPHVIEAPARHVGRRRYHDMQTMRAGTTASRYSTPPH
jgi:hypothetical protein